MGVDAYMPLACPVCGKTRLLLMVFGAYGLRQVTVADVGDGSYDVEYTVTVAGEYLLRASLDGSPIKGFTARPRTVRVLPGDTDPVQSTIIGVPADYTVYVGVRVTFRIVARDSYGNQQVPKASQLLPDVFEVDVQLAPEDPRRPGVGVRPLTVDQVRHRLPHGMSARLRLIALPSLRMPRTPWHIWGGKKAACVGAA